MGKDEFLGVQFKHEEINSGSSKTVEKQDQKNEENRSETVRIKPIHPSITSKEHITHTNFNSTDLNEGNPDKPHEDAFQSSQSTLPTGNHDENPTHSNIETHNSSYPYNSSIVSIPQSPQDRSPTVNQKVKSKHSSVDTSKPSHSSNSSINHSMQTGHSIDDSHQSTMKDHLSNNEGNTRYTRAMTKKIMTRVDASRIHTTMVMTQPYLITQIIWEVGLKQTSNTKKTPCKSSTILTRGDVENKNLKSV